jgi:ATP-dependent DNA helicase RecG
MIQDLLMQEEGKALEFKENASSLLGIVKTVIAFANTAGGTILIGIEDRTKKVIGVADPLEDEMRIINAISDSITPFFVPNIEIQSYRKKALLIIHVPYAVGPYALKKGSETIVYVRFGSTNRIADEDVIANIETLARNVTFDERACPQASKDAIDWKEAATLVTRVHKTLTKNKAKSLGILCTSSGAEHPSNGGVLLFSKERSVIFPDAIIRCVKFVGPTKEQSIDHRDIDEYLPNAIDEALHFITRNMFVRTEIGPVRRIDIPQYPPAAVREAVINAIVHTDYAIKGSSILIAMFDERIEITNPGALPYGLSLEDALAGSSRSRNRVIARTFHFLGLIEQWGSGLQKIIQSCIKSGLRSPTFEELGSQFRVTIYATAGHKTNTDDPWQTKFMKHLQETDEIGASDAAKLWNIDVRSARRRLKKLVDTGFITKMGTSKNDPHSTYVSCKKR